MNLNALYELRDRLADSLVAGVGLIGEDFRLRRALEQMAPLAAASPVFQRIADMAALACASGQDRPGAALLDALALCDAVLCTQAVTKVGGAIEELELLSGHMAPNAPYRVVAPLLEALTGTGGGRLGVIEQAMKESPELLRDYRLSAALVGALGDSYSEIADLAERWLRDQDRGILPQLKQGLDPKGKGGMARRVRVIEALAGAEENRYYISLLDGAEKQVREAAILALRHEQSNAPLLLDLVKTEKGGCKKAAQIALSHMGAPEAALYWAKQMDKSPESVAKFLRFSGEDAISDLVAQALDRQLDRMAALPGQELPKEDCNRLNALFFAMPAKASPAMLAAYRRAAGLRRELSALRISAGPGEKPQPPGFSLRRGYEPYSLDEAFPIVLLDSLACRPCPALCDLAQELYEKYGADYAAPALAADLLTRAPQEAYERFAPLLKREGLLHKESQADKRLRLELLGVLGMLRYDRDKRMYQFGQWYWDEAREINQLVLHPLPQGLDPRWYTLLTDKRLNKQGDSYRAHARSTYYAPTCFDGLLADLINPDDPECRAAIGGYFLERARTVKDGSWFFPFLGECRQEGCRGLVVQYAYNGNNARGWRIRGLLRALPLTGEERAQELEGIVSLCGQKKLKNCDLTSEAVAQWCAALRAGQEMEE